MPKKLKCIAFNDDGKPCDDDARYYGLANTDVLCYCQTH